MVTAAMKLKYAYSLEEKLLPTYTAYKKQRCFFGISDFLEEIPSLSHSVVFLYFFALIAGEGFVISPCYSLELCIQMLISLLLSFAFWFFSFHSYL